jgi:hypothetical protein
MASDAENILNQFEVALTDALGASHSEAGVHPDLRARLARQGRKLTRRWLKVT